MNYFAAIQVLYWLSVAWCCITAAGFLVLAVYGAWRLWRRK